MSKDMGVPASPSSHSDEPASGLAANAGSVPNALLALAERCEAATGPDICLDADIRDTLGLGHDYAADWRGWGFDGDGKPIERAKAFPYTASLDAALTLVPEGCWDHMEVYRPDHQTLGWTVHLLPNANLRRGEYSGFARSFELALCAAALRARAAL